jgi:hypothetical protein
MTSGFDLWDWWERVRRGQAARATCDIVVLSPDLAQERVRFRLYGCLPAKLTGPALDATGNDIAIESLELACEGIDIVRPGDKHPPWRPRSRWPRPNCASSTRASSARSTRRAGSRPAQPARAADVLQPRARPDDAPGPAADLRRRGAGPGGRRAPDDVRRLTERVAYFATPRAVRGGAPARPAVRLAWGTFQFDGHVEALEETLEAFSADGRPLRATLALSLARAQIAPYAFAARPAPGAGG